ncbi:MAG: periplasmic heavy metal sensor [Chlorobiaceae bacterium]
MDFLTSKRVVTTLVAFLVLLNVTLLGMLWRQNICGINRNQYLRQNSFTKPLALSESQTLSFQKLREEHFLKIRPEMQAITRLKKQLLEEALNDKPDTKKIETIANNIGSRQATIEKELTHHFHELATVCKPEQRDSLKKVLERIITHKFYSRHERGSTNHPFHRGMYNPIGANDEHQK